MDRREPIGLLIAVARRRLKQITATLVREYRLSPQQFWTVVAVARCNGLSLRELAERRRMDEPTACRVVNALVRRRLLRSEADPGDRRRSRLALTRSGEALAGKLLPIVATISAAVEGSLSPEEREAMVAGLKKMLLNLDLYVEKLGDQRIPRQKKAS